MRISFKFFGNFTDLNNTHLGKKIKNWNFFDVLLGNNAEHSDSMFLYNV